MLQDFHYYATFCAAYLAGYSHEESRQIAFSAQMVDLCSRNFISGIGGPMSAASTQTMFEMADALTDQVGLQDITRIWASFHFLPYDLNAPVKAGRRYRDKYRLICKPNGPLVVDTVKLAKDKDTMAAGVAMHVLADTWAHSYFAGTPSLVINNINYYIFEILEGKEGTTERRIAFRHADKDDLEKGLYAGTLFQSDENSVMNLGHGRAGHLPDYSFIKYRYLPAWGDYEEIIKDNPSDYYHAFCQMVYALKYLRGTEEDFVTGVYDTESAAPYEEDIKAILEKRQHNAAADWKAFGEKLSGEEIAAFELTPWQNEYTCALPEEKNGTTLGRFFLAVLAQKSMVTNRIYKSGNKLAGYSIDYKDGRAKGIRDFRLLIENRRLGGTDR